MPDINLLRELKGKEITITKGRDIYIDWNKISSYTLDKDCYLTIKILINNYILEEDSGNFETGDKHYVMNFNNLYKGENWKNNKKIDISSLIPVLRQIRIDKLLN